MAEYRYGQGQQGQQPPNQGQQQGPQQGQPRQGQQQRGGYSYNYNYKYSYGSGASRQSGGAKPPQKNGGVGDWIGIAILFCLPTGGITQVIAVIWLIRKLMAMDKVQKQRYQQEARRAADQVKRTAEQVFGSGQQAGRSSGASQQGAGQTTWSAGPSRQGVEQTTWTAGTAQQAPKQEKKASEAEPWERKAQPDAWNVRDQRQVRQESAKRKAKKEAENGTGLIIGGGVLSGIFGLATFVLSLIFAVEGFWDTEMLIPIGICTAFLAGGLSMLFSGIGTNRRNERYLNYLSYIGANREVPLAHMASTFGVSVNKLCKDLRRMLSKGILPSGYLDLAEGKLYLTEMGYHAPEPRQEAPEPETPQQAAEREDDILRQIRQVNDEIPDEAMSAKIDRIEEITGKILAYQKSHPNREGQLRSFLNYYLPTTLKILRAYAQLDAQGIEGENISAAKARIEGMMDQVVAGFEKQLDKLFRDDAMDITSDVEVLENMLKKDGLSDDGITMTL